MQKKNIFLALALVGSSFTAFAATPVVTCADLTHTNYINGFLADANSVYSYPIQIKVNSVTGNSISGLFKFRNSSVGFNGICTEKNGALDTITVSGTNTNFTTGEFTVVESGQDYTAVRAFDIQGYVTDGQNGKMTIESGRNSHIDAVVLK